MLLFAIENGINTESDIPTFKSGLATELTGFVIDTVVGALGVHSNKLDMMRLYMTSYRCFDLDQRCGN